MSPAQPPQGWVFAVPAATIVPASVQHAAALHLPAVFFRYTVIASLSPMMLQGIYIWHNMRDTLQYVTCSKRKRQFSRKYIDS